MRHTAVTSLGRAKPVHPFAWLWEPLLDEPTFLLRPMFGGKSAYLDGKLVLYFAAKKQPWRGVLVCTDRPHHSPLQAEFPALVPHPVLPKWLYLSEEVASFETTARRLVALARRRDPRIGVVPQSRGKARRRRGGTADHP